MGVLKIMPKVLTETFIPDLTDTLNANGGRVSSHTLSYFKSTAMVDIFAARKPVIKAGDNDYLANEEFWSDPINNGFTFAKVQNKTPYDLYTMVAASPFNGLGVKYNRPMGTSNAPFRYSDFCEYWPNAVNPMKVMLPSRVAYETEKSALANIVFALRTQDFNGLVGTLDGVDGYANRASLIGGSMYPESGGSADLTWRAGVYMYADNASTSAVALYEMPLYDGTTDLCQLFRGKDVKMLPILTNISSSILPNKTIKVGMNASDWANTTIYALPDGISTVHFDDEGEGYGQDVYNKAYNVEFSARYYDDTKTSVFIKWVVVGTPDQYWTGMVNTPYVGVYDQSGNMITRKAFATFDAGKIYDNVAIYTAQLDNFYAMDNCTARLYWDGFKMAEIPIQEPDFY